MKKLKFSFYGLAAALAVFNAMFFFSMRSFWSGVYDLSGIHSLPVIIMLLLTAVAVFAFALRRSRAARIVISVLSVAFFAALCYMFSLAFPGWPFILRELGLLAARMVFVAVVGFLLFKLPGRPLKAQKTAAVIAISIAMFCVCYGVGLGGFSQGPAVFAVGDDYQIVFTTRADSHAWVECGGVTYYEAYNGSAPSGTVHKITVPMEDLDAAGEYAVNARTMIMRGPYDAIQGMTYRKEISFRPLDDSDGLQYYCISDTHDFTASGIKTASYFGDKLDFLALCGDHASFITHEQDLTRALKIASGVTGGSVPVVYARGNHEVKGTLAAQLDNYVGADEGKFYYTFRLGSLWGVVLDMGEDHADDWWEFYDTAHFDDYRKEQLEFLRNLDADTEYNAPGVTTRIAICHIPLTVTYNNDFSADIKRLIVDELDGMDISLMFSGHTHKLFWTLPENQDGEVLTSFETGKDFGAVIQAQFPSIIVSRHSNLQTLSEGENETGSGNIGLAVETVDGVTRLRYTNNTGEAIELHDPFTGEPITQPFILIKLP